MNHGLVSVVLCTYNGSRFIKEQLESILRQTYTNLEIIISDDASSDDTFEILGRYQLQDSRIRLYRNKTNLGFNVNFTQTIQLASGNYIAMSDQDDIWHEDKIRLLLENWKAGASLMYCNSVRFTGNIIPWDAAENPRYRRFEGKDCRKIAIFNTVSGHALMIKKELLPLMMPFSREIFYDWWSAMVAACNGGVGYHPATLVFQRLHQSNASARSVFEYDSSGSNTAFKQFVYTQLKKFVLTPNMSLEYVPFFNELMQRWAASLEKKFSWQLFIFLMKHRRLIFWHKKKAFPFFSHFKYAYQLASTI